MPPTDVTGYLTVTQAVLLPASVPNDPATLAALFPGAASVTIEGSKVTMAVEVTTSVQATAVFTAGATATAPAAGGGEGAAGGAATQAIGVQQSGGTPPPPLAAAAAGCSANSSLSLMVVLRVHDATRVDRYRERITTALQMWSSEAEAAGEGGGGWLRFCPPQPEQIVTETEVRVVREVPLNAAGTQALAPLCGDGAPTAALGGGSGGGSVSCRVTAAGQTGTAQATASPPTAATSSPPPTSGRRWLPFAIAGAAVGGASFCACFAVAAAVLVRRRRKRERGERNGEQYNTATASVLWAAAEPVCR
ncbi:hypothetical protein GPECTOR_524g512 [Gonium pectorale]|uniref:Uncharacterized protein n=1 Tax=Gonium pectorale TaxID=33097 RepID=A0A150FUT6_GONPE|nr:hypothetical protein GPECTOR_524g512 [Gonium pectorale]|eukprot:KXZ41357.1 hypothetical protein GPECTOR_524g512 [Gonium pectorale]